MGMGGSIVLVAKTACIFHFEFVFDLFPDHTASVTAFVKVH